MRGGVQNSSWINNLACFAEGPIPSYEYYNELQVTFPLYSQGFSSFFFFSFSLFNSHGFTSCHWFGQWTQQQTGVTTQMASSNCEIYSISPVQLPWIIPARIPLHLTPVASESNQCDETCHRFKINGNTICHFVNSCLLPSAVMEPTFSKHHGKRLKRQGYFNILVIR